MKLINLLIKILKKKLKVNFKRPNNKSLVVFDGVSYRDLSFILQDFEYFVIENRKERIKEINLSFHLLIYSIFYFYKIIIKKKLNFTYLYLYTLIKIINPKVIITTIDNSIQFFQISKLLENCYFIMAIQNANRLDYYREDYKFKNNLSNLDFNSKVYIPNYFCFGEEEIKLSKKYNLNIRNFYKCGSIRTSNYFHYLNKNNIKIQKDKFDICLISEPVLGLNSRMDRESLEEGFAKLAKFTIKFVDENNLKFIFANKKNKGSISSDNELEFYNKYLSKHEYEYLLNNFNEKKDKYSSYDALFQSIIAVGCQSTLLKDKIARKEKILSCNLTNFDMYNFPIKSICSINNCDYENFSSRLNRIKEMSIADYFQDINPEQIMAYDSKESTIQKIKSVLRTKVHKNVL
jgi:surface carbohydrate biosynthesis protein